MSSELGQSEKRSEMENLKESILTSTRIHKAIDDYAKNRSEFSKKDSDLIRSVLFNKLISSNPLGLFAILCKLNENSKLNEKRINFKDISRFLEIKGGSTNTVDQWMKNFEILGYVGCFHSPKKSKQEYFLKKPLSEILRELPPFYCQIIEENLIKDNISLQKNDIFKEIDSIIEYIKCINDKLSLIVVNNNSEEPFEATKIIKTLLECGATISEAFYVLDGILNELNYIYQIKTEKKYISIQKNEIPELIINILEKLNKPEMDHLLYWYTANNIIKETGIKHNDGAAQLIKKEILRKKWTKNDSNDIYYKAFSNIYGCSFDDLKNKKLFLDKIDNFLKEAENFTNDTSLESKDISTSMLLDEYYKLTRNIALSILIHIERLGSNEFPVKNLHNIIKQKQSPFLKENDINNFFNFVSKLRNHEEPLSNFLYYKFSQNSQCIINNYKIDDKIDILFKRDLILKMNTIIACKDTYYEIKDLVDFSPELKKLIDENKNNYPYLNRVILDDFFSDSLSKYSINKKIRNLQSSSYYMDFINALDSTVRLESKNIENSEIEVSKLTSNLQMIKSLYQTLDF